MNPVTRGVDDDLTTVAMAAGRTVRRFGSFYVADHILRRMRAYLLSNGFQAVGEPLVYLLGLGVGLATLLPSSIASGSEGPVRYVAFVAPALLATAAVTVSMSELTFPIIGGFKWAKIFWAMNASPLAPVQVVNGIILAVLVRMVMTTSIYYVLLLAFSAVGDPVSGLLLPLIGILAGMAFGMPVLAFAASIKDDTGQFAILQRFVFAPMFLFSGTFYPLDTLPQWLHWIGWVSPLWHAGELGRYVSYHASIPGWMLAVHLSVLLVLAIGGWFVARASFVRRMVG